jgi:hypothetical protein
VIGIDLHRLMNGIPAVPPAGHLLIQQAKPGIHLIISQVLQQGAKDHEAGESLKVIIRAAFHTVSKQDFSQTARLKKVAISIASLIRAKLTLKS